MSCPSCSERRVWDSQNQQQTKRLSDMRFRIFLLLGGTSVERSPPAAGNSRLARNGGRCSLLSADYARLVGGGQCRVCPNPAARDRFRGDRTFVFHPISVLAASLVSAAARTSTDSSSDPIT